MNNCSTFSFIIQNKEPENLDLKSLAEFKGKKGLPYFTLGIYPHKIGDKKKETI